MGLYIKLSSASEAGSGSGEEGSGSGSGYFELPSCDPGTVLNMTTATCDPLPEYLNMTEPTAATVVANSVDGTSLSLLVQETQSSGCTNAAACQQELIGGVLRGELLGLEEWQAVTTVLADPPVGDLTLNLSTNEVTIGFSESILSFSGLPPTAGDLEILYNGMDWVDYVLESPNKNLQTYATGVQRRRHLMEARPVLSPIDATNGKEFKLNLGWEPGAIDGPQGSERLTVTLPGNRFVGAKGGRRRFKRRPLQFSHLPPASPPSVCPF